MFWICTDTTINWQAVTGMGQLSIGAAVGLVALLQWRTAHRQARTAQAKLRAGLFERRQAKYEEVLRVARLIQLGDAKPHESIDLQRLRKEAIWVFSAEISEWIRQNIEKVATELEEKRATSADQNLPRKERITLVHRKHDLQLLLSANLDELSNIVTPHMSLA